MKPILQAAEIQISYLPTSTVKPQIKSSLDAYNVLKDFYPAARIGLQEMFIVAYLNRSSKVIGIYEVSKGGITGTVADVRLILATALKTAATGIILSHNHPSGNLAASAADINLTKKIKEAAGYFDIALTDHLIITHEQTYMSMIDEGII
jgi:DNA repair protein RadC